MKLCVNVKRDCNKNYNNNISVDVHKVSKIILPHQFNIQNVI